MEVHTFCKVFLVFIFLINHFNCIFGADELSIEIANKTLVPKVDEKILNNLSEVNSSQGTDFQPKSRRKRYVAFPEGSSFSVAFCATVGFTGNPQYIYMSWGLNWGVAYDLPNDTWIINHKNQKKFPKPIVQRRHRRDLYDRLEVLIDNMGYSGRGCVLRALCDSAQYFAGKPTNMVEELIRTIFTLPSMNVLPFEHQDLKVYDKAHRSGKENANCGSKYPDCSFSLIELALGEYSTPFGYM